MAKGRNNSLRQNQRKVGQLIDSALMPRKMAFGGMMGSALGGRLRPAVGGAYAGSALGGSIGQPYPRPGMGSPAPVMGGDSFAGSVMAGLASQKPAFGGGLAGSALGGMYQKPAFGGMHQKPAFGGGLAGSALGGSIGQPSMGGNSLGAAVGRARGRGKTRPMQLNKGGKVKGKAKVNKDSYKNDVIPALLSPGEVVIPRSKTKSRKAAKSYINKVIKPSKKRK